MDFTGGSLFEGREAGGVATSAPSQKSHGVRPRVEHLFGLYEKLTAPMLIAAAKPKRGRKK
jgi:hypothetical protein